MARRISMTSPICGVVAHGGFAPASARCACPESKLDRRISGGGVGWATPDRAVEPARSRHGHRSGFI